MLGAIASHYVDSGGGGADYDSAILARGPAAYFTLSQSTTGGWVDATGNGHTITAVANATAHASGGPTLSGGLTSGRVALNAGRLDLSLDPASTSTYSVAGWVKTTTTAFQYLVGSRGASNHGLGCYIGGAPVDGGAAGTVNWGVSGGGVWWGRKTAETINGGTWRHFVVVFNRPSSGNIQTTDFTIYLEGTLATLSQTAYITTSAPFDMSNWHVGQNPDDGGSAFVGDFSRLAWFPGPLSATDAADIYAAA